MRALVLAVVLIVPQCVLFGPSLFGSKVLLPLDILQQRGVWPTASTAQPAQPTDRMLADLVFELEVERRYAVDAVRSGRLPLWNPLGYCGTPFLAANHTSVFYPLRVVDYAWPGTRAIAWVELLKSVLAGLGAYFFARRAMRASFVASVIGAGLWPLTGFMTLWAGFTISQAAAHLPWVLWATHATVTKPRSLAPIALALAVAVTLVSGHAAVAAHVLIAAGLYACYVALVEHGLAKRALAALGTFALGCGIGFLFSAPQSVPTLDYMRESWRIAKRQEGRVETAPVGARALPAVAMPYWLGSTQRHTMFLVEGSNRIEGPAAAYAGFLALLVLAPIGFAARARRRAQLFWLALAVLGLAQVLGLPIVSRVFELPPLDTLRNNRFTVVTAWSIVAMAIAGADVMVRTTRDANRRALGTLTWIGGGACVAIALVAWHASATPPDALVKVEANLRSGLQYRPPLNDLAGVASVRAWFESTYGGYALLALGGALAWAAIAFVARRASSMTPLVAVLGIAAIAECTAQAHGANPQCDAALEYPRSALLEKLSELPPARVAASPNAFPAALNQIAGLADVRGYDAADPARMVELLQLFQHERVGRPPDYAAVQNWGPRLPSPLADMLGLRWYVAYSPQPPASFVVSEGNWYVQESPGALPRAWLAKRAVLVDDKGERLERLASASFDPRAVVLLESTHGAPPPALDASGDGSARIVVDEPEHVAIDVDARAAGWLVLADRWAPGWTATVDGVERPIERGNHALRAVLVESGTHRVEMRYAPASFRIGLALAALGVLVAGAWWWWVRRATSLTAA